MLVTVSVVSLGLTVFLGTSLLRESDTQRHAAQQNQQIREIVASLQESETIVWRGIAEGGQLDALPLAEAYIGNQAALRSLLASDAAGDGPGVVIARDELDRRFAEITTIITDSLSQGSSLAAALRRTDVARSSIDAALDEWLDAVNREGERAAAQSRRLSARLIWGTLALMLLMAGAAVWMWFALDRSRTRLSEAIAQSEQQFRSLVHNSSDAVMIVGAAGEIIYAANPVRRLLGYEPDELTGRSIGDMATPKSLGPLVKLSLGDRRAVPLNIPFVWSARHRDGSTRQIESIATDRFDDEAVGGFVINNRDVTDRHQMERQLAYRAFHDPLTRLANRALFEDRAQHALNLRVRDRRRVAVILIDLDDFKTINDSLGHSAGDTVIVEMSRRIRQSLRVGDTAARLGGDEFVVLLEEIASVEEAEELAGRLVKEMRRPLDLEGRQLIVQASLGIAFADREDETAASLIRNADVAMYAAKDRGRAGYMVFEPSMAERVTNRLEIIADLHSALENDEFSISYQPVVGLADGAIRGVEALVRWNSSSRGDVSPETFIPLAEETGLIKPIGAWVLSTAAHEIMRIDDRDNGIGLAVNVSVRQLEHHDFADSVAEALLTSRLRPHRLAVEVTETALMRDSETLITQLRLLKAMGVTIAIDDFGTGYSSLSYLARLPVDVIKIDRSFVSGLGLGTRDARIAQMIMGIGTVLGVRTVAEGVEYEGQRDYLASIGCDMAQGYWFTYPVPIDELARIVGSPQTPAASAT